MRCEPPFWCPECGQQSRKSGVCERHDEPMRDANGIAPRSQIVGRWEAPSRWHWLHFVLVSALTGFMLVRLEHLLVTAVVGVGLGGGAWLAGRNLLTRRKYGIARRSRLARRARESSPLTPIARCEDGGRWRILGRVRVLRPVKTDDGREAAAYLARTCVTRTRRMRGPSGEHQYERAEVQERQQCGRFAIVDDSGVAIVDDDLFDVWVTRGRSVGPKEGEIVVRDGDNVEIVGVARWEDAADVASLAPAGYRERGRALVFDGTTQEPVQILREPRKELTTGTPRR